MDKNCQKITNKLKYLPGYQFQLDFRRYSKKKNKYFDYFILFIDVWNIQLLGINLTKMRYLMLNIFILK